MLHEEDEIIEGYCDDCREYKYDLTRCPEFSEEVKRNVCKDLEFCRECCKEALDNRDCYGSCEEKFVDEHRKFRFKEICDDKGLIEKDEGTYTNTDGTILIIRGEVNQKYGNFPINIPINSKLLSEKYLFVKNEDEFNLFERDCYDLLYDLFVKHFNENDLTYYLSEKTMGDRNRILKIEGYFINGLIAPVTFHSLDDEHKYKVDIRNEFLDYLRHGIDFFNFGKDITKYCSVIQDYCEFKINYRGKDSYFAAFPFEPKKWPRFLGQLKNKLQEKRIDVVCPTDKDEDFPETGIVFCKLCKMIHSTNSMISEITEVNQNVMFEAGYALGLGKFCHFLIDKSYDPGQRISIDIISDLEQICYLDPNDCSTYFELKKEDSHLLPRRIPTITGGCCNKKIEFTKNSILLLIPEDDYHENVVKPLIETLLGNDYKINNIEKLIGHDVCNYCKVIQESEIVIGDFVSDTSVEKNKKNSKISFLLGFSLAMEKKVIILQQNPIHKKMIDFKKMTQYYTDAEEIKDILQEIIEIKPTEEVPVGIDSDAVGWSDEK